MQAPIGSFLAVLCVTACAVSSTPFVGTARAVEAALTDLPAGACGAALARVETALSRARASGHIVASAPESVNAMLHRQPTSKSIAQAQTAAVEKVEDSIHRRPKTARRRQARRMYRHAGKGCVTARRALSGTAFRRCGHCRGDLETNVRKSVFMVPALAVIVVAAP